MGRLLATSLCLAVVCGAMAAPAPPAFFKPGWDDPVDPDKDCKFTQTSETLTIEVPGTAHDLGGGKQVNAPRLLRDVKGDFRVEVRVRGEWRLSEESTFQGSPTCAGGALLMMIGDEKKHIIRMDFGITDHAKLGPYTCHHVFQENQPGGGHIYQGPGGPAWPLAEGAKQILYLRFECRANKVCAFYSADGEKWIDTHMIYMVPATAKPKVGVVAFSTSKERCKVIFDKFDLTLLQKEP
jgi:hypothetical protein